MKSRKFFLLFSIMILVSCSVQNSISFKVTDFSDTSLFSEYILPQYSSELMENLPSDNFYRIYINIDREKKKADAYVKIQFHNSYDIDIDQIGLRLLMNTPQKKPMKIQSAEIDGIRVKTEYSDDFTTIFVHLIDKLRSGVSVSLKIVYTIDFSEGSDYYFDFARIDEEGFSIPHFYPTLARIVDGDWENDSLSSGGDLLSSDCSWYMVEIETDNDVVLVSSGKEFSSQNKDGRQKKSFLAGPVRDFFISGSEFFIPQETTSGDTKIISYSKKSDKISSMKAAQITSSAISIFNSKFGTFPFKELKITALPTSALGIEFPGLFAIQEGLYKKADPYLFEPTIVHEAAHQWFYSLIGNNQLIEPWIDEGLTQYAVWLYYRERYGSSAALGFFNSLTERWKKVNQRPIPINKPVSFYVGKEYSAIIYGRAPIFLIELQNTIGEDKFLSFIQQLVTDYSFKNLTTAGFHEELIHFAGPSVEPLFDAYFNFEEEEYD